MHEPHVERKEIVFPRVVIHIQHTTVLFVIGIGLFHCLERRHGPVKVFEIVFRLVVHITHTGLEFFTPSPDREKRLVSPVTSGRLHKRTVKFLAPVRRGTYAHFAAQCAAALLQGTASVVKFRLIHKPHRNEGKIHLSQHRVVYVYTVPLHLRMRCRCPPERHGSRRTLAVGFDKNGRVFGQKLGKRGIDRFGHFYRIYHRFGNGAFLKRTPAYYYHVVERFYLGMRRRTQQCRHSAWQCSF